MRIAPFELERYFARHEFSTDFLLSSSDCDGLSLRELLSWADAETRALWDGQTLGYTESLGSPLLRREIAGLYAGLGPEQVVTAAPQECIYLAMNVLLEKGDHVVSTFPGYQSLYEVARAIGCEVDRWEPVEEEGWRFRVDDLAALLRPRTKLVIVNFPHNPTGALPSPEEFRRFMALTAERGIRVFSDEMYRLLEQDPAARLPAACELSETAVSLSGMSKVFGLAGLRVGWLATRDAALRARCAQYKDYTTICSAGPSELLSVIALRAKTAILRRHLDRLSRNLALLDAFFERRGGAFSWQRPKAGTVGFPRLQGGAGAEAFCDKARAAGVLLLPSTVYGWGDRHVRVGFGRENMPAALERLAALT